MKSGFAKKEKKKGGACHHVAFIECVREGKEKGGRSRADDRGAKKKEEKGREALCHSLRSNLVKRKGEKKGGDTKAERYFAAQV